MGGTAKEHDYTICRTLVYIHSKGSRLSSPFPSGLGLPGSSGRLPPGKAGCTAAAAAPVCCMALITANVAASEAMITIWLKASTLRPPSPANK